MRGDLFSPDAGVQPHACRSCRFSLRNFADFYNVDFQMAAESNRAKQLILLKTECTVIIT